MSCQQLLSFKNYKSTIEHKLMKFLSSITILFFLVIHCKLSDANTDNLLYTENQLKYLIADFKNALISSQKDPRERETFLDTFVRLPEASEKISCKHVLLAINLGGTYLQLGLYSIAKNELKLHSPVEKVLIPKADGSTKKVDCFEWIAKKTKLYLEKSNFKKSARAGITFSHPIKHESISVGRVLKLGKDFPFRAPNLGSENDAVKLVNAAFKKFKVPVKVDIILNDATATAASLIYGKNDEKAVTMGIVLGTGTNAAYIERQNRLTPTIINTEWASFDKGSVHRCEYDEAIEKMVKEQNKVYKRMDALIGGNYFMQLILQMAQKNIKDYISSENHAQGTFMMRNETEKSEKGNKKESENVAHVAKVDTKHDDVETTNRKKSDTNIKLDRETSSNSSKTNEFNTKAIDNDAQAPKSSVEDDKKAKESQTTNPSTSKIPNDVLVDIKYALNLVKNPNKNLTEQEKFILKCYKRLKRRSAQILMSMMIAIVESQPPTCQPRRLTLQ
ncbi:Hexokinase [Trachipleistophora hominis]|uniref:Phosphotransferase n=1 Tax=Trachipleistophora hominis TaxID=72359 RepID=L7JZF4_TRAHO|nr:Hexokinase [Trachipleistophora hominis]